MCLVILCLFLLCKVLLILWVYSMLLQGELAIAFGDLLRKLWSLGQTTIAPRAFKGKLARFAPQFSGYNQHDSQVSTITYL